jgi:hypothetical protein
MDLRGIPTDGKTKNKRRWTRSYLNLTAAELDRTDSYRTEEPEKGLVSWISMMSRPTELPPYFAGSAKSPLIQMLEDGHEQVQLTEEDFHKLYAWIDLLVPFAGDYREGHAWSEDEMKYYDYFENKRKAQQEEERQNIIDYLAGSVAKRDLNPSTADFTRAAYRSVVSNITLSPNSHNHYPLGESPPVVIDRLSLRTDADKPVHVRLRDRETGRVFGGVDLQPGEIAHMRFNEVIHAGSAYLDGPDETVRITVTEAMGVFLEELPGDDTYRRHLSLRVPY